MFRRFHNATTIIPVDTLPASGIAGVPYMLPDGTFWVWKGVGDFADNLSRIETTASIIGYKKSFTLEWLQYCSSITANEVVIKNDFPNVLGQTMILQRDGTTTNLAIGLYGVSDVKIINALSFMGWAKYRLDYNYITNTFSLYINDTLFDSVVFVQNPETDGSKFVIDGSGGESFDGYIAWVKASCANDSLIWDMNNLELSQIQDSSGNNNTGTVVNVTKVMTWVPLS